MSGILLFGGTSEGRELAAFLAGEGIDCTMSVATQSGLEHAVRGGKIIAGRMNDNELRKAVCDAEIVIDATHPYASGITGSLRRACEECGREYIRILRPASKMYEDAVYVKSAEEAAEYLGGTSGNILLTTGAKTAACFTKIENFQSRIFLRMLPAPDGIRECLALGYSERNLICMRGPFTREMNEAMLRMTGAKTLVTKDGGAEGGLPDKLAAAKAVGVRVVIISRPEETDGISLAAAKSLLKERFGMKKNVRRFPVFIDLSEKAATVIGGGRIATRRVTALLEFCGSVTVIAPELSETLHKMHDAGQISWIGREYKTGDLSGAAIALAATDSREVNHAVTRDARKKGILCSVADCAVEGDFWFPGLVLTGGLTVGVTSTNGDHGAVKRARERIEEVIRNEASD